MMQLDRRAWSQFLALARPYWVCERKWTPWGLAALLIALLLTYTHFSVVFNDLLGDFASALADRDGDRFWAGMRLFLVLLILAVPVNAFYYFVRDKLALLWRQWMTAQFLGGYLQNRAYYGLAAHPTIEGSPGPIRFLAVFCKSALPPETVLKAGQRALAAGQGDPDAVHTLDLGCGEAFAGARVTAP